MISRAAASLSGVVKSARRSGNRSAIGDGVPVWSIVPWYCEGRNEASQFLVPFEASPRWSGSTTKVGRLSFTDPSPYETQLPMLGKPGRLKPVV